MAYLHTCAGCALRKSDCAIRTKLRAAIAGLGVTAAKHRCASFLPHYPPGASVQVKTYVSTEGDGEDGPAISWFPATFIRQVGTRGVAFIKPGTEDETGIHPFEPRGNGFVKVPLARIRAGDQPSAPDISECVFCGVIPALGQKCQGDPEYRAGTCLADKALDAAAAEADRAEGLRAQVAREGE